jgi:hypothetical protein
MDANTIIGIVGGAIELIAFWLNNSKRITNDSVIYDAMNCIGSFLLAWYAFSLNSLPFIIINIVWGGVSLWDVLKYLLRRPTVV